jgi:hypothetical protein
MMLHKLRFLGLAALLLLVGAGFATATPSPPGAKVFFVDLKDGETVKSPFTVHFGVSGITLAPAGTEAPNSGHHHLLINAKLEGEALKQPIPVDDHHLHFGKGQTEAVLTLPPGKYTLQLVLGDWGHVPHEPPVVSAPVSITVQ